MDMQKAEKNAELCKTQLAPQFPVRSGIIAGASVDACLENMYYWQKEYYNKCGGPKPVPYTQ